MQPFAYFCLILMVIIPGYLVIRKRRFWYGVFTSWFFLVAGTYFSTWHQLNYLADNLIETQSDATGVGLTMFSGWILAIPYCAILLLIRIVLSHFGIVKPIDGEQDADDQLPARAEPDAK